MKRQFLTREPLIAENDRLWLASDEVHHARDVVRLSQGDALSVFDDFGSQAEAVVEQVSDEGVCVRVVGEVQPGRSAHPMSLCLAVPKGQKFDDVVRAATELGVEQIVPLITRHGVVQFSKTNTGSRVDRWERVAKAAAKQSGRCTVPRIEQPIPATEVWGQLSDQDIGILCVPGGPLQPVDALQLSTHGRLWVCIGPEGGWSSEEMEVAQRAGYTPWCMGSYVLRCETAAVAAVAVLSYWFTQQKT